MKFSSALGSVALPSALLRLYRVCKAKSHNDSASGDCGALTSFSLGLYLNFPLSGNAPARLCQQQVGLLSSQSRGTTCRAKGRVARLSSAASRQFILGQGESSRAEPKLNVSHSAPVVGTLSPRVTGFCVAKRKDDAFGQNNAVANWGCLV